MTNRLFDPLRGTFLPAALAAIFFLASCGNRVSPAPKPQSPPPPFEFLGSWGDRGNGPGKLDAPVSFAADSLGRIYFADPGSSFVHKFESKGTPLLSFEDSRVRHAAGIAVDSGGAIYVADAQKGSILIFFPDGTFLRDLRIAPQKHFSGVLGIAVDADGNLYAPNPAASRILKFDNRGRSQKSWPAPQKAASAEERPSWVATGQDGSVFVAYFKTGRIEKFSSDGSWMTSWSASANSPGVPGPITGFAVSESFVFTMAASSSQIRVWTIDGRHRLDADLTEHVGGAAIAAPQIAVAPHEEILVFDPAAPKVFRFHMHLQIKEPL